MKNTLNFLVLFFLTSSLFSQTLEKINIESQTLTNQINCYKQLSKVANIIDSDTESYWAYNYADSLISTIKKEDSFNTNLSKIYSSYSYIFYGMSYTRSIQAISRGEQYTLKELNGTLIYFTNKIKFSNYDLARNEIAAIYSMINFYKVARMSEFENMHNLYINDSIALETKFKKYPSDEAYKIVSLQNKKLHYKIMVTLISDIYFNNNPKTEDSTIEKYFYGIINKGKELDKLPNIENYISELNAKDYSYYLSNSLELQSEMIQLLIDEIKKLKT